MNILVTGGCGFVGRHLISKLLKKKHNKVTCVDPIYKYTGGLNPDNWPFIKPKNYKNFKFIREDCRYFFSNNKNIFDKIYHLAAIVGGRMMIDYNPLAVAEDLAIDSTMWNFAKKNKKIKVINFSSSAVYPIALQNKNNFRLLKEKDVNFNDGFIGQPDMTYGWSKLTNEYLGKIAYENHKIESVVFRPFSGYGSDQDLSYPFPSICLRALRLKNDENKFYVWGSGDQMRDFIHIDDCVDGILKLECKIKDGSPINLSSGKYTSFKDLAKKILVRLDKKAKVIGLSKKPEGVFARAGKTDLQKKLGFSPRVSIELGIEKCLSFLKKKE